MGGNGMVSLTSASPEPVLTAGQIPVHGEVPGMEPNANMSTGDRSPIEEEKSHGGSNEGERIVEWGGPGSRYGKVFNLALYFVSHFRSLMCYLEKAPTRLSVRPLTRRRALR